MSIEELIKAWREAVAEWNDLFREGPESPVLISNKGAVSCKSLLRIIDALDKRTKALEDFAEGDCAYRDGCPKFGTRHGRCGSCLAREALEEE